MQRNENAAVKLFMQDTIEKYGMISDGDRIVCGVSGGADSVAMLCGLLELKKQANFTVCVAHLNHMLRGDESDRDANFVKALCDENGVELFTESIDIGALAGESGESVELAARNARYAFFQRVLSKWGGNKVATAHNAEDNLETVLMHLTRGAALNGLGGIPPVRGHIIRPLIETTRERIKEYLKSINQGYVEDSTNSQRLYTRNRVRLDIVPLLRELNPKVSESVARSSQMLREDEQYILAQADKIVRTAMEENKQAAISIAALAELPTALQRRVILQLARAAVKFTNFYLEFEHICDIINLTHTYKPSAKLNMPGGLVVMRKYDVLLFVSETNSEKPDEVMLSPGGIVRFGDYEISCHIRTDSGAVKAGKWSFAIPVNKAEDSITVRSRKSGDVIKLPGRPEKTLKKLFIEEKIPKDDREKIPVLVADEKVAAVCGFGADERLSAIDKEKFMWVEVRRILI